jgi:hypothetical protein
LTGDLEEYYPPRYDPGGGWQAEPGFALRHEGLDPGILDALFAVLGPSDITAWISASPTGKYVWVAWYLYE